ncbi:seryl-tRNA synthetase, mitochondrial [Oratosquilla oratoria]|uniref:seryl-tRNA synthetase, mitochondrial n=1 Tax=Oratosquilla oratoria TaxID=337810 RepID=UPI003F768EFE
MAGGSALSLLVRSRLLKGKCPVGLFTLNKFFSSSDWKRNSENKIELDYDYLCDPSNTSKIEEMIHQRKGVGDIRKVIQLYQLSKDSSLNKLEKLQIEKELQEEALHIPNQASPHVWNYGEEPKVLENINQKPEFTFKPKELHEFGETLGIIRTKNLGNFSGPRSYYFQGGLAKLEQALIKYTVSNLISCGFTLLSVPDLLYSEIIESCGMDTKGPRTQVYHLANQEKDVCLSGTAEMAIAGYLKNKVFTAQELPLKFAAVSRCYRAETSSLKEERGIYRVHNFGKVEMFGVTAAETGQESKELYNFFVNTQKKLFQPLEFHFQVLDMPLHELGAPAFCKTDLEAWMPGRNMYGEISSTSNCTDFQSRRLNIRYRDQQQRDRFVHTVNGTACALPRMLLSICETHQRQDGTIAIPGALQPFLGGLTHIGKRKDDFKMKYIKQQQYTGKLV